MSFTDLQHYVPKSWKFYADETLLIKVAENLNRYTPCDVCPRKELIFQAFSRINPADVNRVFIGSPYATNTLNNGMFMAVTPGKTTAIPTILNNYLATNNLPKDDLSLDTLVSNGTLLLNYPLTCVEKQKNAHINIGWEPFVVNLLEKLMFRPCPLELRVFDEIARNLCKKLATVWIPDKNIEYYTTPYHKNVKLIAEPRARKGGNADSRSA